MSLKIIEMNWWFFLMKIKSNKKVETIFLILGSIFICTMIFLMPINRVPDEANHARMAWETVHKTTNQSFKWMDDISDKTPIDKKEYSNFFINKIDMTKEKFDFNFKASNLVHLPQLIGMSIAALIYPSVGLIFILGRIMNGIVYVLGMYFIIRYAKFGKFALSFISLLPIMIQQAASLSYDVANYLAISFFFALITNIVSKKEFDEKNFIYLIISIFLLYNTKKNNLALLVLLVFVRFKFSGKMRKIEPIHFKIQRFIEKKKTILISMGLILSVLIAFLFLRNNGGFLNFIQVMFNSLFNNNANTHLNGILTIGMFGYLGLFNIQFPLWIIFLNVLFIFILMYADYNESIEVEEDFGLASFLIFPIQVILIVGGMYFAWTPVVLGNGALISVGAQGRYFTPFIVFTAPFLLSRIDKLKLTIQSNQSYKILIYGSIVNFLLSIILILLFYWFPDFQLNWLLVLKDWMVK